MQCVRTTLERHCLRSPRRRKPPLDRVWDSFGVRHYVESMAGPRGAVYGSTVASVDVCIREGYRCEFDSESRAVD